MIHFLNTQNEKLIAIEITGKIKKEDVERIHTLIHKVLKNYKKVDFFFELKDFKCYELGGLWSDLKVDAVHFSDYGKMVLVGERKWHEWAAKSTNIFSESEVKYFELDEKKAAKEWIGL